MTPDRDTVAILGLGLIGGSLARDLAGRGARVMGYDADAATLDAACEEGIVRYRLAASLSGVSRAQVVIVAVPLSATQQLLAAIAKQPSSARLVMDVASTKRTVIAAAESLGIGDRFVGSHPMAGDHRSGWSASRLGLFASAKVYLCPAESTRPESLERAQEIWTAVGALPRVITADAHDSLVAFASHLPHVASAAIAAALAQEGVRLSDLGPGGKDVVRIAASSPEMWTGIVLENAEPILRAIASLEKQLAAFADALTARDTQGLHELFIAGREWTREAR